MATTAQKAVLLVGGAAGLGYGAYYMAHIKEVSKFDKDLKDIQRLIEAEQKKITQSAKLASEFELRLMDLSKQGQDKQKAVADTELKLEAARQQVKQLEGQLGAKKADAAKVAADLKSAQQRLADLRTESERARESVMSGEKSLGLAAENLNHAKLLLNPLNHPRLKALTSGSGKK